MKKLMLMTIVLLLVFSGSVIASSEKNGIQGISAGFSQLGLGLNADFSSQQTVQDEGSENVIGTGCWQCTSYIYVNGSRICVSAVWRTTCPVYG